MENENRDIAGPTPARPERPANTRRVDNAPTSSRPQSETPQTKQTEPI